MNRPRKSAPSWPEPGIEGRFRCSPLTTMNSNSFFRRRALLCSLLSFTLAGCQAADSKAPEEVGTVKWGRDMDEALRASAVSGKPVFALFQEVPGCAGCKQFGREVLSNAALVAVIHESFTPVLIHNNAGGSDAATLKKYNEPAWNFQVVRFLNPQGADLIPRQDRVWETAPLARRMAAALKAAGRPVPARGFGARDTGPVAQAGRFCDGLFLDRRNETRPDRGRADDGGWLHRRAGSHACQLRSRAPAASTTRRRSGEGRVCAGGLRARGGPCEIERHAPYRRRAHRLPRRAGRRSVACPAAPFKAGRPASSQMRACSLPGGRLRSSTRHSRRRRVRGRRGRYRAGYG